MSSKFSLRKILSLHEDQLKDYFDQLDLEVVIPRLLQYFSKNFECENVIWLVDEELRRLTTQTDQEKNSSPEGEQVLYSHLKRQSILGSTEQEIKSLLEKFTLGSQAAQQVIDNNLACLLLPIRDTQSQKLIAYVIMTGVPIKKATKSLITATRDLSFMSKHICFSYRHWEAQKLSFQDDLTGLFNQKYMSLVLESEINRSQRENEKFTVLFMDVDYFKSVNDKRGHWVGSRLLIEIGQLLKQHVRRSDYAFRYGGDEFVLVLTHTDSKRAVIAAERLRSIIEKHEFIVEGDKINLTLSIGLATFPDHAKTYKEIIKMADEAMYRGKNKSRNIVFVAS